MMDAEGPASADEGLFGLGVEPDDAEVIVIPVPFDATASYGRRTAAGPAAILGASPQLDLFHPELGRPYEAGIAMLSEDPAVIELNRQGRHHVDKARRGGAASVNAVNQISRELERWVRATTETWMARNRIVAIVGGDHSTPLGNILAYAERFGDLGVLHIDAHFDLRRSYEGFESSHASIMHNVLERTEIPTIVQVGIRDFSETEYQRALDDPRVVPFLDEDIRRAQFEGTPFGEIVARIIDPLPRQVYVSFDIDGLEPALCPSTGTPVPGGLTFQEATYLLRQVAAAGKRVVGFDLTEVAPSADPNHELDGNVGARVLYTLCGVALANH